MITAKKHKSSAFTEKSRGPEAPVPPVTEGINAYSITKYPQANVNNEY